MTKAFDTRDRKVLQAASIRSFETARILCEQKRYNHAMYIGGYAIEAALASWLCLKGGKSNLKKTSPYEDGIIAGAGIHNLGKLENLFPEIIRLTRSAEKTVSTNPKYPPYHEYWKTIVNTWKYNELRYSDKVGDEATCKKFMTAVKAFYEYIHHNHLQLGGSL